MLQMLRETREYVRIYLRSIQRSAEGKERARKDKLRVRKKARTLNADRFRAWVDRIAIILKAGDPTYFAHEGACRQGVRVSLIESGWTWHDADTCALEVVAAALKQIGAVRPTHDEGQPEYVSQIGLQRVFCARCGTKIPEDRHPHGGKAVKYCSTFCGQMAYQVKARAFGEKVSVAEHLARCAEQSAKTLMERARDCEQCRKPFLSLSLTARFCSRICAFEGQKRSSELSCIGCGKTFAPNRANLAKQKFCSHDCYVSSRTVQREASCAQCLSIFRPRFSEARGLSRFCSSACSAAARRRPAPSVDHHDVNARKPDVAGTFLCEETK